MPIDLRVRFFVMLAAQRLKVVPVCQDRMICQVILADMDLMMDIPARSYYAFFEADFAEAVRFEVVFSAALPRLGFVESNLFGSPHSCSV